MASPPCYAGSAETLGGISKPDGLPEWRRRVHYQFAKTGVRFQHAADLAGSEQSIEQVQKPLGAQEEVSEWRRHPYVRFGKVGPQQDFEADTTDGVPDTPEFLKMDAVPRVGSELEQATAAADTLSFLLSLRHGAAEACEDSESMLQNSRLDGTESFVQQNAASFGKPHESHGLQAQLLTSHRGREVQDALEGMDARLNRAMQNLGRQNAAETKAADPEMSSLGPADPDCVLHRLGLDALPPEDNSPRQDLVMVQNEAKQVAANLQMPTCLGNSSESSFQRPVFLGSTSLTVEAALQGMDARISETVENLGRPKTPEPARPENMLNRLDLDASVGEMEIRVRETVSSLQPSHQSVACMQARNVEQMCGALSVQAALDGMEDRVMRTIVNLERPESAEMKAEAMSSNWGSALHTSGLEASEDGEQYLVDDIVWRVGKPNRAIAEKEPHLDGSESITPAEISLHGMDNGLDEALLKVERPPPVGSSRKRQEWREPPSSMEVPFFDCPFSSGLAYGFMEESHSTPTDREVDSQSQCEEFLGITNCELPTRTPDEAPIVCQDIPVVGGTQCREFAYPRPPSHKPPLSHPRGRFSRSARQRLNMQHEHVSGPTETPSEMPSLEKPSPATRSMSTSMLSIAAGVVIISIAVIAAAAVVATFTLTLAFALVIAIIALLVECGRYAWRSLRNEDCEGGESSNLSAHAQLKAHHPFFLWDALCYFAWCFVCLLSMWLPQWTSVGRHKMSQ